MKQAAKVLRTISYSIIIAGIIVGLMGAYYTVIKAGIPYQDAPEYLQIQYAAYMQLGEQLGKCGLVMILTGILLQVIKRIMAKAAA